MTTAIDCAKIPGVRDQDVRTFCRLVARGFDPELAGSQIALGPNESLELMRRPSIRRAVQDYRRLNNEKPKPETNPRHHKKRKCLMCGEKFMSHDFGERVCTGCKKTRAWRGATPDMSVAI